jgi:hypothetical protein
MAERPILPTEILDLVISWSERREQVAFLLLSDTFGLAVKHVYRRVHNIMPQLQQLAASSSEAETERANTYGKAVRVLTFEDVDFDCLRSNKHRKGTAEAIRLHLEGQVSVAKTLLPNLQRVWAPRLPSWAPPWVRCPQGIRSSLCRKPDGELLGVLVQPSYESSLPGCFDILKKVLHHAAEIQLGEPHSAPQSEGRFQTGKQFYKYQSFCPAPLEFHDIHGVVRTLRLDMYAIESDRLNSMLNSFPKLQELGIDLRADGSAPVHPDVVYSHGSDLLRLWLSANTLDCVDAVLRRDLPSLRLLHIHIKSITTETKDIGWTVRRLTDLVVHIGRECRITPEELAERLWIRVPRMCNIQVLFYVGVMHKGLTSIDKDDWIARFKALRLEQIEKSLGPPGFSLVLPPRSNESGESDSRSSEVHRVDADPTMDSTRKAASSLPDS